MKKVEKIANPHKYSEQKLLTKEEVKSALDNCVKIIAKNMEKIGEQFPDSSTLNNKYEIIDNTEWTTGFWTGMLWLAYEYTHDNKFKELAEKNILSFKNRLDNDLALGHHDLGFLYNLSCISSYKLTGNQEAKKIAIDAADYLVGRFQEKGEFIQAWGPLGARDNYRLIIDCLLNIPLLYWAAEETGNKKYYDMALKHYKTSINTVIREDGSSFHTFFFDPETGVPLRGAKRQGYSNESTWARGQAWGIYGVALTYRSTKDAEAVNVYESLANFYLNRLPEDYICYWDLIFSDEKKRPKDLSEKEQPRDSSSAAIAVCGLNEMCKYLPETHENKQVYKYAMHSILRSLVEKYATKETGNADALILHGTYALHQNRGVDEGTIWGDYYYMEALMRFYKDWELYC